MKITKTVEVEIDVDKVWLDVWGNDGHGFAYWCGAVRDVVDGVRQDSFSAWKRDENDKIVEVKNDWGGTDWVPNPHDFAVYDHEEDKWHIVTLEKLCMAWFDTRQAGLTHCGGCSLDDPDDCTEDFYLQYAVFGDVIYG